VKRVAALCAAFSIASMANGLLAAERSTPANAPRVSTPLAARLDEALSTRRLRGASVAALVVSRGSGRVLYERGGDQALVPASNEKILTAVAALATFGPAHCFTTHVLADGRPDAAGAVGTWPGARTGSPRRRSASYSESDSSARALQPGAPHSHLNPQIAASSSAGSRRSASS